MMVQVAACNLANKSQLVGEYQANWDERERLILAADGTYFHQYFEGGEVKFESGQWQSPDASIDRVLLHGFQSGHPGATSDVGDAVSAPSVHRTVFGNKVVISMSTDRNLVFVGE